MGFLMGSSVPRRPLSSQTSPFHWAKSTVCTYTTSPTQHVRPPSFRHCWSVRLEQSSGPWPQSELHRGCFQAPARHFYSHGTSAPSALGGGSACLCTI